MTTRRTSEAPSAFRRPQAIPKRSGCRCGRRHTPPQTRRSAKKTGKKKLFDFYVGGENLTNYFQQRATLGADRPFCNRFDASMIRRPVDLHRLPLHHQVTVCFFLPGGPRCVRGLLAFGAATPGGSWRVCRNWRRFFFPLRFRDATLATYRSAF